MLKFCCVIFSFNRAMQLDLTLRSLTQQLLNPDVHYTVIYQCTAPHEASYEMLMKEWGAEGVVFKRCDDRFRSAFELRRYLLNPRNLYRWLRKAPLRKRFDNFKELVEQSINETGAPFTFFSTDDQYLYKPTRIPQLVLDRIQADPEHVTFRMGMSDSLKNERGLPEGMKVERIQEGDVELLEWNADDPQASKLWEYSFNVDFQLFDSAALLALLSPILYHIPTTLEWAGLRESRRKKQFRRMLGTAEKTVVGMQLNLAQTMVQNEATDFSLDTLKTFYEKGCRLTVTDEQLANLDWLFMPSELFFYHEENPEQLVEYQTLCKEMEL
ncbi:MAG: hypothetical protein JXR40_00405 [Pontiellaceae bacterium]|nr:hypothetical protein [Pontiellaceae bacterium]